MISLHTMIGQSEMEFEYGIKQNSGMTSYILKAMKEEMDRLNSGIRYYSS